MVSVGREAIKVHTTMVRLNHISYFNKIKKISVIFQCEIPVLIRNFQWNDQFFVVLGCRLNGVLMKFAVA